MEGTTIQGRGVRKGRWAASASCEGVTISMDCEVNSEWWSRLTLTRDELAALLRWVDDCRTDALADAEIAARAPDDQIPF